ncbi:thermopsin precursor, partial [mine drainage metagenome]
NWSIGPVPGYRANRTHGSVVINGSRTTIPLNWTAVTYTVHVQAMGLPNGTLWWINLTRGGNYTSATGSLNFTRPNGTYAYTVGTTDPDYAGVPGNITVTGGNQTVDLFFEFIASIVSFASTGLPNGTHWSAVLGNQTNSSTSAWVNFTVLAGVYGYQIGGVPGYTLPTFHGHIAVGSGLSYEVALSWTPTTYPIQFTEQGLPNGTVWTVTVNGTAHTSNLSGITVPEVNGSYPYSFGPVAGFISPSADAADPGPGTDRDRRV